MKKTFREYHQFTEEEFEVLWKNCIFVFDTNTLLDMYRYSRSTVDEYMKVLEALKSRNQLWIPYHVGYEFYENRVNIISTLEKSYDEILSTIENAKSEIQQKYKNHPFLDLTDIKNDMDKGLAEVVSKIKKQKNEHPKWIDKDEVLERLNNIFDGNVGNPYDEVRLEKVRLEGKERYDKKVPPGFKDGNKTTENKYGDLILWYQIIDRAKDVKKPIILVSGDVKDDWWLKKDGNRIMPLPQLKKEMLEKAFVDFHIYTPDRFLEYYQTGRVDEKAIREVRKIRQLEEARSYENFTKYDYDNPHSQNFWHLGFGEIGMHLYENFREILLELNKGEVDSDTKAEFEHLYNQVKELRNKILHGIFDESSLRKINDYTNLLTFLMDRLLRSEILSPESSLNFIRLMHKVESIKRRFRRLQ